MNTTISRYKISPLKIKIFNIADQKIIKLQFLNVTKNE